jgi:hypothetical protein
MLVKPLNFSKSAGDSPLRDQRKVFPKVRFPAKRIDGFELSVEQKVLSKIDTILRARTKAAVDTKIFLNDE